MTSEGGWSWPPTSWCWTTAGRSPTAHPRRAVTTRASSTPIWASPTRPDRATMSFFFEVLIGGLLAGVMYSMVALGFVLIYKASGAFNFAQGSMVLFGALTFVSLVERRIPFLVALAIT